MVEPYEDNRTCHVGEVPWLGSVLDSGKCLWILGSVLDSGKCLWILGSVLDSEKCFIPMGHRIGSQCFPVTHFASCALVSSEGQIFYRYTHWKSAKDLRQKKIAA